MAQRMAHRRPRARPVAVPVRALVVGLLLLCVPLPARAAEQNLVTAWVGTGLLFSWGWAPGTVAFPMRSFPTMADCERWRAQFQTEVLKDNTRKWQHTKAVCLPAWEKP